MELHLALKNIVNLSGTSILKEQRLVNILADFNAYEDVPSAKFIIKTIIDEGYMEKLLANGKWDLNCDKLVDQFAVATGIVKDNVNYVFESLGFSLGWNTTNPVRTTIVNSRRTGLHSIGGRLPCPVDVVNSMQGRCKLELKNPTAAISKKGIIIVSSEIHGILESSYVYAYCSIYVNNALIQTERICQLFSTDFTGFTIVSGEIKVKSNIQDINRIVIYIGS